MPRLTLTEKSKATTKPWWSRLLRRPARKLSGSILAHTHAYLLATDPHREMMYYNRDDNEHGHKPKTQQTGNVKA